MRKTNQEATMNETEGDKMDVQVCGTALTWSLEYVDPLRETDKGHMEGIQTQGVKKGMDREVKRRPRYGNGKQCTYSRMA